MKSVAFESKDQIEIVELIDKKTRRPILTIFLNNRKFHSVYEHKIMTDKIQFIAEYVNCDNAFIAAGYALSTQQYARRVDIKKFPDMLRVSILNALPSRKLCSPSTQVVEEPILTLTQPAKVCDPTTISLCPVTALDPTSTENN